MFLFCFCVAVFDFCIVRDVLFYCLAIGDMFAIVLRFVLPNLSRMKYINNYADNVFIKTISFEKERPFLEIK